MVKNIPSGPYIVQITIKIPTITNQRHSKNTQIGIFGLKIYHLATLIAKATLKMYQPTDNVNATVYLINEDAVNEQLSTTL
jgi:hypothetical protein